MIKIYNALTGKKEAFKEQGVVKFCCYGIRAYNLF